MRLLTDEEIGKFKSIASGMANDLANTTEGHFKPEDIDAIYLEADKAMCKEQDKATLKAVGGSIDDFIQMHLYARPDKPIATMKFEDWMKLKRIIESLKRGEMPDKG